MFTLRCYLYYLNYNTSKSQEYTYDVILTKKTGIKLFNKYQNANSDILVGL